MRTQTNRAAGFTRKELLLVLTAVLALGLLFLIIRSAAVQSVRRISCIENIKQINLSYILWADDHRNQFPFAVTNGGSQAFANSPQVFQHYLAISNKLITPKILVCPADKKRQRQERFAELSNANISYFVGLSAENDPNDLLAGDRHITGGTLSNSFLRVLGRDTLAGWTAELHHGFGNVGTADGAAHTMVATNLQQQINLTTNQPIRLAIP